jgi:hypothetical protein
MMMISLKRSQTCSYGQLGWAVLPARFWFEAGR